MKPPARDLWAAPGAEAVGLPGSPFGPGPRSSHSGAGRDKMSAVENMKSFAEVSVRRAQDIQKIAPPFQALDGIVPGKPKLTADQVFRDDARRASQ